MTDLLVLGGGVAGLTAALRAVEADPALQATVLEAGLHVGGKVRTVREGGFWVDLGPDVFVARRAEAAALCHDVGLEPRLRGVESHTSILHGGALHPLPDGWSGLVPGRLGPLLRTPLLPLGARLRAVAEPLAPPRREAADESLEAFFTRRFGAQTYARLIEPLVGGLYGSDLPVSLRATLPYLHEMEQQGGLIRAWRKHRPGSPPPFIGLEGGMDGLPNALKARLIATGRVALYTGVRAAALTPTPGGYRIETEETAYEARSVIAALPATAAAAVLAPLGEAVTAPLRSIPHGSVGSIALGYRAEQIAQPFGKTTGFLVPRCEGGAVQAVTVFSTKHPGAAPEGHVLFRVFVRPEADGCLAPLADLIDRAEDMLRRVLKVEGLPCWIAARAWQEALPRFALGHLERMETLRAALGHHPGLYLVGAPYRGAGLSDAIASAEAAARQAIHHLHNCTHAH